MKINPECSLCELCSSSPNICVPGKGNLDSPDIMVVMESPTTREAKSGRYMQGDGAQLLLTLLEEHGYSRDSIFFSYLIKCTIPFGKKVKAVNIKACSPYIKEEIERIKPKWVLLCGATPLKLIKKTGIMDYHGNPQEVDGISYFPMISPSMAIRDPSRKPIIEQAIVKLVSLVDGSYQEPEEIDWEWLTPAREEAFWEEWDSSKEFSFDVETTGLIQQDPSFTINTCAVTLDNFRSWCIPLFENEPDRKWGFKLLKKLIKYSRDKWSIAHNGKFDNSSIFSQVGDHFYLNFDTMLASHLLDENSPNGLKFLSQIYCGAEDYDELTLAQKTERNPDPKLRHKIGRYNCLDTYYTFLLGRKFKRNLAQFRGLNRLYKHLVMPAARAFEVIDYRGHYIRMDALEKATIGVKQQIAKLEVQMNSYRPSRKLINWGSPAQVGRFLFDYLKLPILVKTPDGKPSTGESALLDLKESHPIVSLLLEWRGLQKLLNTYLEGYRQFMVGNMLYISTKLHGTVTGRFSSRLHQTPREGTVRNIYGAPPGYLFMCADFSQIELRLVADASSDSTMRFIFQTGGDIHVETAKDALGITHEPTKEQRKAAKAINFGFIYGMGDKKFKVYSKEKYGVEITDEESTRFRKRFFSKYYDLKPWHDRVRRRVAEDGMMKYPSGRIRRLPGVFSPDEKVVAEAKRQAINSPIQGFGSGDLKVMALLALYEEFEDSGDDGLLITGEVHDSVLGWVKADRAEEIGRRVKEIMEHPPLLDIFGIDISVPLVVDVEIGEFWGDSRISL